MSADQNAITWVYQDPVHYAEGEHATRTACGRDTIFAIFSTEPETVAGCRECLAAVPSSCPGGCGWALDTCRCFAAGWDAAMRAVFPVVH